MPVITSIEDLRRLHKRRVPRMFFDYCESGSYTEQTFRDNVSDFSQIRLRQKVAVDMSNRSTAGTMIGRSYIYGLGAMGEAGVTKALEVIQKELSTSMALCGERDVKNLGRHNLLIPKGFEGDWQ